MNWKKIAAIAACLCCSVWAEDGHRGRSDHNNQNGNDANGGFESGLVGSVPKTTAGGVASGGLPWVAVGEASVSGDGRLHLEVSGLLIADAAGVPANLVGTVGPITKVAASLVCGGSGGSVVGSSDGSPLSVAGNAEIDTTITLPATCMAPVVLVRIFNSNAAVGSQLGAFIALSGFNAGAAAMNNNGSDDHGN
jgi:hypothetical protein